MVVLSNSPSLVRHSLEKEANPSQPFKKRNQKILMGVQEEKSLSPGSAHSVILRGILTAFLAYTLEVTQSMQLAL